MYDAVNPTVLKEIGNVSKDVAPLIATLVKQHRLSVVVLMVLKVMEEVHEIDDAADQAMGR